MHPESKAAPPAVRLLYLRRLLHALDNNGLRGLLRRVLSRMNPGSSPKPDQAFPDNLPPHPFDLERGVDTSGYEPGETLTPHDLYNTAYYAISPGTLRQALKHLPCPPDRATFVDLGCGKGRALLVAAELPFALLAGVEIADSLAEIARRNCMPDRRIEIATGSAFEYQFPAGPLVVFMYHPFLAPRFRNVVRSLLRQRKGSEDPAWLLLANFNYFSSARRLGLLVEWHTAFDFTPEEAAADRHGQTSERYTLYRLPAWP